jgi:hypothetical protein
MVQNKEKLLSQKYTGFEDLLSPFNIVSLPLSAGFFFVRIFLTPDSETNESLLSIKIFERSVIYRPFLFQNHSKNE